MEPLTPLVVARSFSDFDELTDAIRGWNIDLFKLDTVPFSGRIFQLIDTDCMLSRGCFSSRLRQVGEPPVGFRTFVVPACPNLRMLWRARHVDGNDLLIFPPGGELLAYTEPGFDVFTLSVSESALIETGQQLGIHGLEEKCRMAEVVHCLPSAISDMRWVLQSLESDPRKRRNASAQILSGLALLLQSSGQGRSPVRRDARRLGAIQLTERYLLNHPDDPVSIAKLCEHAGVSKRTLEYAFSSHLDITPKRYINRYRLNAVRKLLRSTAGLKVSDAANAWGFWHMGQFAADYHKLFGELPSETMK